jgi:hypothetical protein
MMARSSARRVVDTCDGRWPGLHSKHENRCKAVVAACPLAEICNSVKSIGFTHGGSPRIYVLLYYKRIPAQKSGLSETGM